jgi:hypothetical protein
MSCDPLSVRREVEVEIRDRLKSWAIGVEAVIDELLCIDDSSREQEGVHDVRGILLGDLPDILDVFLRD